MIKSTIDDLFETIENSSLYMEYQNISSMLKENTEIEKLLEEIRTLQKEATKLEYSNDKKYLELDKIIEEKITKLNSYPIYQEYLDKMKSLNDCLSSSCNLLENYVEEVVN